MYIYNHWAVPGTWLCQFAIHNQVINYPIELYIYILEWFWIRMCMDIGRGTCALMETRASRHGPGRVSQHGALRW